MGAPVNLINNTRVINGFIITPMITENGAYVIAPAGQHIYLHKLFIGDPDDGVAGTVELRDAAGTMVAKFRGSIPANWEQRISKRQTTWGRTDFTYINGATLVVDGFTGDFIVGAIYDTA